MTKSKELEEEQRQDTDINKRHYGEDVKFYLFCMPTPTSTPREHVSMLKHLFLHCWKVPGLSLEGQHMALCVLTVTIVAGVRQEQSVKAARDSLCTDHHHCCSC